MSTTEETLVREALHGATDELAAPVQRMTATAARNGRRLRLRRRVIVAVGSVCAAALVGVPVALALGPSPARDSTVATDPSIPLPGTLPASDQPGWWDMPATEMLQRLKDTTPHGLSYADPVLTNEGENAPGEPVGVLRGWVAADVVADGQTAGGINILLLSPGGHPERYTCPGNLTAADRCTEVTDDAGEPVGRTSVTTTGPVTVREVVLRQDDGGIVYVAASNSADDKWGSGSAVASERVPLSMTQLLDIASYRQWTTYEPR